MQRQLPAIPGDGLDGPAAGTGRLSWLLVIAVGETLTLAGLLVNLFLTAHNSALAAALGPLHGALYLGGVLLTWSGPFAWPVKLAAVIPVAGVWFAVGHARDQRRASTHQPHQ